MASFCWRFKDRSAAAAHACFIWRLQEGWLVKKIWARLFEVWMEEAGARAGADPFNVARLPGGAE